MENQHETVMGIEDVGNYLNISKSTVYKLAQEGKIPGQKVGKQWRFLRSAVDKWLSEGKTGQTEL